MLSVHKVRLSDGRLIECTYNNVYEFNKIVCDNSINFCIKDTENKVLLNFKYEREQPYEVIQLLPFTDNFFIVAMEVRSMLALDCQDYQNKILIFNSKNGNLVNSFPVFSGEQQKIQAITITSNNIALAIDSWIFVYNTNGVRLASKNVKNSINGLEVLKNGLLVISKSAYEKELRGQAIGFYDPYENALNHLNDPDILSAHSIKVFPNGYIACYCDILVEGRFFPKKEIRIYNPADGKLKDSISINENDRLYYLQHMMALANNELVICIAPLYEYRIADIYIYDFSYSYLKTVKKIDFNVKSLIDFFEIDALKKAALTVELNFPSRLANIICEYASDKDDLQTQLVIPKSSFSIVKINDKKNDRSEPVGKVASDSQTIANLAGTHRFFGSKVKPKTSDKSPTSSCILH